ncbi:VOC family protein [Ruegeria pomeroyi]|uniref:VOC family protein n=1 Tax=Ruegeria pomeroyi TaxID=89184 RepID=UPI001F1D039F|nr:VOC family protein [Ruegeria pomeroyi]MCE8509642.1 VOC family protein [Ruegeria pomeroyi]
MTSFPQIDAVYETHLPVRDLDRAVEFYRDTLGLELAYRQETRGMAFFWIGGQQTGMLGLWQAGSAPMRMMLHMAFRLGQEAVLAVPAALKANGAEPLGFDGEPVREPVVIGWMPALTVYCKDPDGHSIEFLCPLPDAPDPDFGVGPWSRWLQR